ncbi:MAG: hypothetical protein HY052_02700 [Proteobacteria bacterium]|nr:hypothetical protein [Pseudomonadota bacterium]
MVTPVSQHILKPGRPDDLGATPDNQGVNFALFSANATRVELCLFDDDGKQELSRIELTHKTADIWHGYIPGLKLGQIYSYRVHGPDDPANGHRFDPSKLVLDPYAREVVGQVKARVTAPLGGAHSFPATPWDKTVIFETHVKGLTIADPAVPEKIRGTCAAMGSAPVLSYLKNLGVTAIELLPMQTKNHEEKLKQLGLKNYWGYNTVGFFAIEPGIDGFRFDLAPVLGRTQMGFDPEAPFFKQIAADPVLSKIKLIAEPWDCGVAGYQLGNFPPQWHEWNDKFRDDVRRFWRGDAGMAGSLATRLAGSSPEFDGDGSSPLTSINMITCHDGFTLHDVVSYSAKKNSANGDGNSDGNNSNFSDNCGVEGGTDDPVICGLRERQKRNMLATLFLAQGVPMLLAGDEFGNSQKGNNNAYCQDNGIGWLNRDQITEEGRALTRFVQKLTDLRKNHSALQQEKFPHENDISWVNPSGRENMKADWENPDNHCLGMVLSEGSNKDPGKRLLAIFNAAAEPVPFVLPKPPDGETWRRVLDTSELTLEADGKKLSGTYTVPEKSVVVFVPSPGKGPQ